MKFVVHMFYSLILGMILTTFGEFVVIWNGVYLIFELNDFFIQGRWFDVDLTPINGPFLLVRAVQASISGN